MGSLESPIIITKDDIKVMFDQIRQTGIKLIENSASLGGEFILHAFIEYSKYRDIPLIIEDIFDTLPLYLAHLKLMGIGIEDEDIRVIKVGGTQEAGQVLAKVRFENSPHIYRRKIDEELERILPEGDYIHLVLGLERLLTIQNDTRTIHAILSSIRQKLDDERGVSVYLLEKPLIEDLPFNPLPFLENVATSVMELMDEEKGVIKIKLKKSHLALMMNTMFLLVSPREVLRWWE